MAAPSITELPEKTINGFVSKWNASNLPIQYVINNDKSPVGATVTNYFTQVLVFVNGVLIGTIKQVPDSDNNTKIDIRKFVQDSLKLVPSFTGLRDTNASAEFYIEGSEEFLDSSGIAQSNAITGGGSGVVHFASLSALQFGSINGGNMYNHVLDSSKLDLAQWMTFFERGQLVDTLDFLLSIIVNDPVFDLEVKQFDVNANLLDTELISIGDNSQGVYRLNLGDVTFNSDTTSLTVQALISVYATAISEVFTIDVDLECFDIPIPDPEGWNLLTLTFVREVDLSAQVDSQQGIELSPDGTKMFIADGGTSGATDSIHEYNLTTPFNISTRVFVQSKNVSAQDGDITDVRFGSAGSKMYVIGRGTDTIYGYNLSSAFDISTAVHSAPDVLDVSSKDSTPVGMVFKPDGTKLYFLGAGNDKIYEYDLSIAFDITSAVFLQDFALPTTSGLSGIYIKTDGTRVYYISSFPDDKVFELILSPAFDISSATAGDDFDLSAKTAEPRGLYFKTDGLRMYFVDQVSDKAFEYSLTD